MPRMRLCSLTLGLVFAVSGAAGADVLRVGNDAPTSIPYCALDIGMERGIFRRHDLDIEASTFFGSAKGQPALVGGTIDVLLGAGSEMAFIVKGAPELAVAVIAGPPADMAIVVAKDSPVDSFAKLKGRKVGISNPGGLTDWLAHQIIKREGFGPNDVVVVSAGNSATETAMLRTGGLDAAVMDAISAFTFEAAGGGRVLQTFGAYVPDFAQGVIYAHRDLIKDHPARLSAFLAAWFEAQAAMLSDKPAAVACIIKKIGGNPDVAARIFDIVKSEVSADGRFQPKAMDVLAQSFVDGGVLPSKPDMTTLYTETFLPRR